MNGECISFHLPAHMFFLNRSLGHHLVLGSQEPHCWVNLKLKYDRGRGTVEGINAGNVQTVASVDLPRGRSKGIGSRQRIEKGKGGALLVQWEALAGVLGGVTILMLLPNGSKFGCLSSRHMAVIDYTISDSEPSFLRMRPINRTLSWLFSVDLGLLPRFRCLHTQLPGLVRQWDKN